MREKTQKGGGKRERDGPSRDEKREWVRVFTYQPKREPGRVPEKGGRSGRKEAVSCEGFHLHKHQEEMRKRNWEPSGAEGGERGTQP